MIKRNNKKGFTIVELVIVIAVIAILAAVLIPTFAGIIKKANLSADQQAVRQMNVALATASAEKTPANIDEVAKILADAGFNAEDTLVPVSKDHRFYWSATYNVIVLVKGNEVVFPTDNDDLVNGFEAENNSGKCYDLKLGYGKTEIAGAEDLKNALANGENVAFNTKSETPVALPLSAESHSNNKVGRKYGMLVEAGEVVSIDLGGNTLTTDAESVGLVVEGEVVLSNGTISSRGITVLPGGKLTIEDGVTVEASADNGGAAIRNFGVVTINGGVFNAVGGDKGEDITYEPGCIYNEGYMVINGGTFTADSSCYAIITSGTLIINDATVTASRGAVSINSGEVVIEKGTFNVLGQELQNTGYAVYFAGAERSTCTINGGTFTKANSDVVFGGDGVATDAFKDNRK